MLEFISQLWLSDSFALAEGNEMAQYWSPPGGLVPLPSGIGVTDLPAYATFYNDVDQALRMLYQQPVGQMLINGLILRRASGRFTTIKPPRGAEARNEAQSLGGDDARTVLAHAIGSGDDNRIVDSVKIALASNGHANDYLWLAQQLNNVPRYQLQGAPAAGPGNLGVLPSDVERWLKRQRPPFNPFTGADLNFVQNALQIVINDLGAHVAGAGGNSIVYWNPTKVFSTLTTGVQTYRASYIGLAHELIHAYHNAHGTQLSWSEDPSNSSTVLFEYMCVGLGPWQNAVPTENGVRSESHIATRPAY